MEVLVRRELQVTEELTREMQQYIVAFERRAHQQSTKGCGAAGRFCCCLAAALAPLDWLQCNKGTSGV